MKSFALPMILTNLTQELAWLLPDADQDATVDACIAEILNVFYDEQRGLIFENVSPDGTPSRPEGPN